MHALVIADPAQDVARSTVVTALSRNGSDFGIRVAGFDRQAVTRKLGAIGVAAQPSGDDVLRFRDADGITVELRGV